MTELLTAAQMRAIETRAIKSGEVTGLELMERAGRGVVEAVFAQWPELARAPQKAVVLCGPGNNGGDGFVVARLLQEWGWDAEVFLYGDPGALPPDAKANYERWRAMGATSLLGFPVPKPGSIGDLVRALSGAASENGADLLVDALFGTGLTRAPEALSEVLGIWENCHCSTVKRGVAVDVPSGLCADSGRLFKIDAVGAPPNACMSADLTVAFQRAKLGHFLGDGPVFCGRTVVADIGLDDRRESIPAKNGHVVSLACPLIWPRDTRSHKYSHGHALILSGGAGRTGAARLAARGALRVGAGLVTLGVPPAAQQEVACQITALMLRRMDGPAALEEVLQDKRINSICLGPGMGAARARELVTVACGAAAPRPTVLDADALTAFEDDPAALFAMLHEDCVLTPHGGEFARLFPDISEMLDATPTKGPAHSKVDAARAAAKRAGCVVLFKGPDTVIAAPDGRCSINAALYDRAAPWLATAGAGDVLAGFIAGLLAQGLAPMQAAETAAWLHVACARRFGPGLVAEDLPEQLPGVFRDLGL